VTFQAVAVLLSNCQIYLTVGEFNMIEFMCIIWIIMDIPD
jgi:hypothetical protein